MLLFPCISPKSCGWNLLEKVGSELGQKFCQHFGKGVFACLKKMEPKFDQIWLEDVHQKLRLKFAKFSCKVLALGKLCLSWSCSKVSIRKTALLIFNICLSCYVLSFPLSSLSLSHKDFQYSSSQKAREKHLNENIHTITISHKIWVSKYTVFQS